MDSGGCGLVRNRQRSRSHGLWRYGATRGDPGTRLSWVHRTAAPHGPVGERRPRHPAGNLSLTSRCQSERREGLCSRAGSGRSLFRDRRVRDRAAGGDQSQARGGVLLSGAEARHWEGPLLPLACGFLSYWARVPQAGSARGRAEGSVSAGLRVPEGACRGGVTNRAEDPRPIPTHPHPAPAGRPNPGWRLSSPQPRTRGSRATWISKKKKSLFKILYINK